MLKVKKAFKMPNSNYKLNKKGIYSFKKKKKEFQKKKIF